MGTILGVLGPEDFLQVIYELFGPFLAVYVILGAAALILAAVLIAAMIGGELRGDRKKRADRKEGKRQK